MAKSKMDHSIKKPVMVNTKTNQEGNKKLKKGEVGRMLQTERPIENEVTISLKIKAVKFGNRGVESPETTTIFNGRKINQSIPFKKNLDYKFKKVEDGMVFKFAITSAGDLLGFLYLEIPQKFKSMNKFKLDDWFPVKQVQTDEEHQIKAENFLARVIINYKATRKLVITEMFNTKMGNIQMLQELALTMKQKLKGIHKEVDAFGDEGFRHLGQFEKKMMKKRIKMRGFKESSDKNKKMAKQYFTDKPLTKEKKDLYKLKQVLTDNFDVRKGDIQSKDLYNFKANDYKKGKNCGSAEYNKLLKELSYARKELIETKQKFEALEEGQLTVDNIQYRKKLQDLQNDLMKDRTELTIRLREQSNIADSERARMKVEFDAEKENLEKLQKESDDLIMEYNGKLEYLRETEKEMDEKNTVLETENSKLKGREDKVTKREKTLKREIENYEEMAEELDDTKERLMMERRKIFEESENFNYEKGNIDLRAIQIETKEDFLNKERMNLEKEKMKFQKETEKQQKHIEGQKELFGLEKQSFDESKKALVAKVANVLKEVSKNKMDKMNLWKEKTDHQKEVKEFMEYKAVIEEDQQIHQEELDNDYEFIDEQLNLVEGNKRELDALKENLENYENFLENQQRLINEKQKKFDIAQRKFFEKLHNSNFDIEDMKEYGEQMGIDMSKIQKSLDKEKKFEKKILEQKSKYKQNIDTLSSKIPNNNIAIRRTTIQVRRTSRLSQANRRASTGKQAEMERSYKIKKGVDELIENIFANVNLKNLQGQGTNKDELIVDLEEKVEKLKALLEEEKVKTKKLKLAQFVLKKAKDSGANVRQEVKNSSNVDTQKKSVTIVTGNDQGQPQIPKSMMRDSMASMKTLKEPASLKELKMDVKDLVDMSIMHMKDNIDQADNKEKIEERLQFLERSKTVIDNIFKALNLIHNSKKDFDNGVINQAHFFNEDFDFELLKERYETKIKTLVDYIKKIRDNNDFFNFSVDNNVLTS